jgi:restriction system protein
MAVQRAGSKHTTGSQRLMIAALSKQRHTIKDAIINVMKNAGVPLSGREAYDKIVAQDLYEFHAQDPTAVVIGQIRRHCKDLDFPTAPPTKYFGMSSDGKFYPLDAPVLLRPSSKPEHNGQKTTLSASLRTLKDLHRVHRDLIKDRVLRDLKRLPPDAFENFSRRLLEIYGFERMKVTAISNDGGIDGFGKLKVGLAHMNVAFQCKRWTSTNVGRPEIDKFRGAIQGEYEQGIFFTTASFTTGAKQVSIKPGAVPIILIDGSSIVELMIDKEFGVERESLPVYTYALDLIMADELSGSTSDGP